MTLHSQNGWVCPPQQATYPFAVGDVRISLLDNYAGLCLAFLATWYDEEIEPLIPGQTFGGVRPPRPVRGSTNTLSNHDSFLAEDLNSLKHKRGFHHTFSDAGVHKVHQKLFNLDNAFHGRALTPVPRGWDSNSSNAVIRWGEDYHRAPVDGMHMEWTRNPEWNVSGGRLVHHMAERPSGQVLIARNKASRAVQFWT